MDYKIVQGNNPPNVTDLVINGKRVIRFGVEPILVSMGEDLEVEMYKWYEIVVSNIDRESHIKHYKEVVLQKELDKKVDELTKSYPKAEVNSFTTQEAEAVAYKADDTVATPFIDSLCEKRGVTKDVLVDKILTKAAILKQAIGGLVGAKQKLEDNL